MGRKFDGIGSIPDTQEMNLDIATVLFSSLLIGLALVLFSWSLALGPRAPRWRLDWAWGNTALFLGVGLFLTQGKWSPWVSVILANGLVIAGYHLLENGLRRFADRPLAPWLGLLLFAAFLVPFVVFTFVWDLFPVRVVVYSALVVAVWIRILRLLPRLPEFHRRPVLGRSIWVLCLLILLSQAGRAVVVLGENGRSLLAASDALALMLLISVLVLTAWSLGFVTLDIVRSQRQLEAALETRDRMLQLIAHDLRGPLGGQIGLLEMMQQAGRCRDQEDGQEMLNLLTASAQNSFDLLENLLDWGQNQKGAVVPRPEPVSARELLVQASEPYAISAQAKGIVLQIDVATDDLARVDRKTVATILRNLVSNAVKFTPPGGQVQLSYAKRDTQSEFVVSDTGPGLRPDQLARLNEGSSVPSTPGTESEHGSGLGLALCRDFARLNGALLRFTSSPQGTTASLVLKGPT